MLLFKRILWTVLFCTIIQPAIGNDPEDDEEEDDLDLSDLDGVDANLQKIDDFIGSLEGMQDMLTEFTGDADGCVYTCENGDTPTPKEGHVPESNGCGTEDHPLDVSAIPGVTECCDEHDYCYDTCNSRKVKCDEEFKQCMKDACRAISEMPKASEADVEGCNIATDMMKLASMSIGCKAFRNAQRGACSCPLDQPTKDDLSGHKDEL